MQVFGAERELTGSLLHAYDEDFAAALALLREPETCLKILIQPNGGVA